MADAAKPSLTPGATGAATVDLRPSSVDEYRTRNENTGWAWCRPLGDLLRRREPVERRKQPPLHRSSGPLLPLKWLSKLKPLMFLSDLFQVHGSIVLRSIPAALFASAFNYFILHWSLLYGIQTGELNTDAVAASTDASIMLHPGPFAFFLQGVALILALFGTVAYQRFWEARSAVAAFGATYYAAAAQLLAFDEPLPHDIEGDILGFRRSSDGAPLGKDELLWLAVPPWAARPRNAAAARSSLEFKRRLVMLISLQHAVCMERLMAPASVLGPEPAVGQNLDVLNAEPTELDPLRTALACAGDSKARSFLVHYWLQQLAIRRHMMFPGSTNINGSIAARAYGLLESGFASYCQACKVDEAAIPPTLTQLMCLTALLVLLVGPLTVALWVPVEGFSMLFSFIVVFSFEALGQAAFVVAAPFKHKLIPLRQLHESFNDRLRILAPASGSRLAASCDAIPSNLGPGFGDFCSNRSTAPSLNDRGLQLFSSVDATATGKTPSDVESPSDRSSGGCGLRGKQNNLTVADLISSPAPGRELRLATAAASTTPCQSVPRPVKRTLQAFPVISPSPQRNSGSTSNATINSSNLGAVIAGLQPTRQGAAADVLEDKKASPVPLETG